MKSDRLKEEMLVEGLGTVDVKSFLLAMPDEELLQSLMPKQVACQLIAEYANVYEALMNTSTHELAIIKGMWNLKYIKLNACVKLYDGFIEKMLVG